MVAVPMDARRRHEAGQALEQLEGCEAKGLATVHIGLGEAVDQAGLRRGERPDAGGGVKPLQRERPPGAVANEPLETRPVSPSMRTEPSTEKPPVPRHVRMSAAVVGSRSPRLANQRKT